MHQSMFEPLRKALIFAILKKQKNLILHLHKQKKSWTFRPQICKRDILIHMLIWWSSASTNFKHWREFYHTEQTQTSHKTFAAIQAHRKFCPRKSLYLQCLTHIGRPFCFNKSAWLYSRNLHAAKKNRNFKKSLTFKDTHHTQTLKWSY